MNCEALTLVYPPTIPLLKQLTRRSVPNFHNAFFTFYEFVEQNLYGPRAGYYTSGNVSFSRHYSTFPIILSPTFGQLIAIHAFNIWAQMRKYGVIKKRDSFFIIEIGGGDGTLAYDALEYITRKAKMTKDWKSFSSCLRYIAIDLSKHLLAMQKKKNQKFADLISFIKADIRKDSEIPGNLLGLKGLVISNELVDNFPHHKIYIENKKGFSVSLVLPFITKRALRFLIKGSPLNGETMRTAENSKVILLSREFYLKLIKYFSSTNNAESITYLNHSITWREDRADIKYIGKELKDLLDKYFPEPMDLTTGGFCNCIYFSPDYIRYLMNLDRIIKSGYIFTIDYGGDDEFIMDAQEQHCRVYGGDKRGLFREMGYSDITFDVNFRLLIEIGEQIGLNKIFYGPQRMLADYYNINLRRKKFKDAIVEKRISSELLYYIRYGLNKTKDAKRIMLSQIYEARKNISPYFLNTYLMYLIEDSVSEIKNRRKIELIKNKIDGVFEMCEDGAVWDIDEFYSDSSIIKILIQRKGCDQMDLYS